MDNNIKIYVRCVVLVCALVIVILAFYANRSFFHDDAFITLRYALNFINGYGFVWNPGERVEGYSSFLHLLTTALLGRIGIELRLATRFLGIGSFCIFLSFALLYISSISAQRMPSVGFTLLTMLAATSFPLIIWALGGLESVFFSLLCTGGIWIHASFLGDTKKKTNILISAVTFALASLTRLDAILLVVPAVLFMIFPINRDRLNNVITFCILYCCIFIPYFTWRFLYYHNLFPNTYYVKAAGFDLFRLGSGFMYFRRYLMAPPFLLLMVFAAGLYLIHNRSFDRLKLYLLSTIFIYLMYIIYVGGDHMPSARLFLPVIPTALLFLYKVIHPLQARISFTVELSAYAILLFLIVLQFFNPWLSPQKMDDAAYVGTIVGKYLDTHVPTGTLIALNTAGSTPYYAGDNIYIDMLGLNDRTIARRYVDKTILPWQRVPGHAKGDGLYVLSRNPDIIILGPSEGTTAHKPWFLSDYEIAESHDFSLNFKLRRVAIPVSYDHDYYKYSATSSGTLILTYYERNDSSSVP